MTRILLYLALSAVLLQADPAQDKFDLSVTAISLKGTTLELSLKIVNQSAGPVKIDLSSAVVVVKSSKGVPSLQAQNVSTRTGIYKPRVVLLEPSDQAVFFTSTSSRLFAPNILAPGATLELTKAVNLDPVFFLKDVAVQPYRLFLNLAYRVDPNPDCQATASSPTYKVNTTPDGKLALAPE